MQIILHAPFSFLFFVQRELEIMNVALQAIGSYKKDDTQAQSGTKIKQMKSS